MELNKSTCMTEVDYICQWIEDPRQKPGLSGGGNGAHEVVYMTRDKSLTTEESVQIINMCELGEQTDRICTCIPSNPVGGNVYIVDLLSLPNIKDVRVDKFVWVNIGRKKYPRKSSKIYKTIYKIRLQNNACSSEFQKFLYEKIENSRYVIVQYVGDASVYEPISHGNSKNNNLIMRRTCPSVFDEIKRHANDVTASANLLEKESKSKAETGNDLGVKTARNLNQVKNHLYKARRENKLSKDDLYNLIEISYELENFNKQIDVFPSLVCISGMDGILQEFNDLLIFDKENPIKMFYDTTYKLGELFVSVLSYQHIIFEKNPIIPLAFMMHDKRDAKFHKRFFEILTDHVPNLEKTSFPIVCDREPGIKAAISKTLPNLHVVHCWNHIKTDVKVWLNKHKATQDDLQVYLSDVTTILKTNSEQSCLLKIDEYHDVCL
ncbi:hypothetical protein ACF0H5_000901 [Mactra antiquata]